MARSKYGRVLRVGATCHGRFARGCQQDREGAMSRSFHRWSWAFSVLTLLATMTAGASAQQKPRAKAGSRPAAKAGGARFVSAVPAGRWIGQDGHDVVGPATAVSPSDVQDIHIALAGLPRDGIINFAKVSG